MAKVDTTEIETVYGALSTLATNTLQGFVNSFSMTETTKAQVLSTTMTTLIQTSVQVVQEQPLKDAQIAVAQKDLLVKDAQIAQATAQTNAIISDQSIKAMQSTKDLSVKEEQRLLIVKQQTTEGNKAALTVRQTTYYNDQCKMEKSKHYSSMTMGALQSGATVPQDLWTATFTAANNITTA